MLVIQHVAVELKTTNCEMTWDVTVDTSDVSPWPWSCP